MKYLFFILLFSINISYSQTSVDSLISKIDSTKIDSVQIDLHYEISRKYKNSDIQKSIAYAEQGIILSELFNDSIRLAGGFFEAGTRYNELGLYDKALGNLTKAKSIYKKLNKGAELLLCLNNIGNVYWLTKDFEYAIDIYRTVYNLALLTQDSNTMIFSLGNIGICQQNIGYPDSTIIYYNLVLDLSKKQKNNFSTGLALFNIGGFYYDQGKHDIAIKHFEQALEYDKYLSSFIISKIYSYITKYKIDKKQFHKAQRFLDSTKLYTWESNSLSQKRIYYNIKYQLDSTSGDFLSAINSLLLISVYDDSIKTEDYNEKMADFKSSYELEIKESEIIKLKIKNEIVTLESKNQWYLLIFLIILFFSSIIIIYQFLKSNRTKQNTIKDLNSLNSNLTNHREELAIINEEVTIQRGVLADKNRELETTIKKLNETQSQLLYSEKLASIGVLARGAAHEINNPLNFIVGGLYLMDSLIDNSDENELRKLYKMIKEGAVRIETIIKGLNTFTQSEDTKPILANINGIIETTLQFVNYKIDSKISIIKDFNDLPETKCYPDKLHVIILNIISNSIDALELVKNEKTILIKTSLIKEINKEFICIRITNSGLAIDEQDIKKLFDPFFTTKYESYGVGMGLTIAYNLVKEHKGDISVKNREEGVEFTVKIPSL